MIGIDDWCMVSIDTIDDILWWLLTLCDEEWPIYLLRYWYGDGNDPGDNDDWLLILM